MSQQPLFFLAPTQISAKTVSEPENGADKERVIKMTELRNVQYTMKSIVL